MIFVTVGTHEQPFDRLLKEIDRLVETNVIKEKVIVQRGYSSYCPMYCESYDFISFDEMKKYINEARIVITHGGPASFLEVMAAGKVPVVVPRQKKFFEHVNDHQLTFCKELYNRGESIIVVEDVAELKNVLSSYSNKEFNYVSNNKEFNNAVLEKCKNLFDGGDLHDL